MTVIPEYLASASYYADKLVGPYRLVVAVECIVAGRVHYALLDTGADWCVLLPEEAAAMGYDLEPDPDLPPYSTRYGLLFGRRERAPILFPAEVGEPLEVDATWFISADWPGPLVIGWKGCLERMRFALDPSPEVEQFYFGPLGEAE